MSGKTPTKVTMSGKKPTIAPSKKSKKEESTEETDDSTYESDTDVTVDTECDEVISSSEEDEPCKPQKSCMPRCTSCTPQAIEDENLTMFSSDEICVFVVNDYSFSVHKHILRKMHIFDALLDGDISNQESFQIPYPNIKQIYVVKIIDALSLIDQKVTEKK